MKEDVFNQYVDKVLDLFGMDKERFFSKSKERDVADARQLLYYLCCSRKMRHVTIKKFMIKNGFSLHYNSISNGINNVKIKIEEDRDYQTIIKELEKSVFI